MKTLTEVRLETAQAETKRLKSLLHEVYLQIDASQLNPTTLHKLGMEYTDGGRKL